MGALLVLWDRWHKEIKPGSVVADALEFLEAATLNALEDIRRVKKESPGLNWTDAIKESHRNVMLDAVKKNITERQCTLGAARATRLLSKNNSLPDVVALRNPRKDDDERWVVGVLSNIDAERAAIDAQRVLWITAFSAFAAAIAAVFGALAVIASLIGPVRDWL